MQTAVKISKRVTAGCNAREDGALPVMRVGGCREENVFAVNDHSIHAENATYMK